MSTVSYRPADVDGFKIFYLEAGPTDRPAVLLLHGFPSASHMFRDLIRSESRRSSPRTATPRSGHSWKLDLAAR